jgi:hypothetical protein
LFFWSPLSDTPKNSFLVIYHIEIWYILWMEEILHHLVVVTNSMPIVTSYQLLQDGLSIHSSPAHHSLGHP